MKPQCKLLKYTNSQRILFGVLSIVLTGCSLAGVNNDISAWVELTYVVNTDVEIQVKVPSAEMGAELHGSQFITTKGNPVLRLFDASYDPGWGSDRDLLITTIAADIIKVERESEEETVTLEAYRSRYLLTHKRAARRFDIIGVETHANRQWLKNRFKGEPHGVSYSTIIDEDLVLQILMTMYGKGAEESTLFENRLETLEKILSTVKISKVNVQ